DGRRGAGQRRRGARIRAPRAKDGAGLVAGKTAFILAGGASRGAYQAGCLKRLEEDGITPDLIIGSSIGVCNSLVYASGGAEALWAFWSGATSLPAVFSPSVRHNPIFGNSLFSMDSLATLVEREVDFDACFN